jgi:Mobilization protein NikA
VNLRLSEQEYQELTAAAATVNITLAGYVARAALAAAVEQIPPDAFESLLAVMRLHGDVARVGNNVNQIARALNSGGAVPSPSIEAALAELRALMQHLDNAALDLSVSMKAHRAKRAKACRPSRKSQPL